MVQTIDKQGAPFKVPLAAAMELTSKKIKITASIFQGYLNICWAKQVPMDQVIPEHLYDSAKKSIISILIFIF